MPGRSRRQPTEIPTGQPAGEPREGSIDESEDESEDKSRDEFLDKAEANSKIRQRKRLDYYQKQFGQQPKLPTEKKAKEIYSHINKYEPYFKTAMAGPTARMQSLVSSPEFKEALYSGPIDDEPTKEQKQEIRFANKASDALTWSIEAFGDAYGSYSDTQAVEGVRQSHQFKELLGTRGPNGGTFYDAMKAAAIKQGKLDTFYNDMAYIDHAFQMGIDLPKRDPESVKKAHPEHTTTWADYKREHLDNVPHEPEAKKDYLAKVLVSAFEEGVTPVRQRPFSPDRAEKFAKQLKEQPVFKKFCEDPGRVNDLLKNDPSKPGKHYNALMNMYRPFGNISKEKANSVLRKIKGMLPYMEGKEAHNNKWKELVESIETIDLDDPNNSGEKKLQELFDKTTGYEKGRKSLRKKEVERKCFDQSMDVLAELAKCGQYAKAAAETVVDRTNEVRLGHDRNYSKIGLGDFGASKIVKHTNKRQSRFATDELPEYPSMLPPMPEKQLGKASPVGEYTELLEPLASDRQLNDLEAVQAVATAIALSKTPVYFYNVKPDRADMQRALKQGGKAVVNGTRLQMSIMTLQNDPEVQKIAKKYKDPEARKVLFKDGRPQDALVTDKIDVVKGKEQQTFKRSELPLNNEGRPDLTKLRPDHVTHYYKKVNVDVSKFNAGIITQEYEQAKGPVQNQTGPV